MNADAKLRQIVDEAKVPDLVQLLWDTLLGMESKEGYDPNDPVSAEFRQNVLRLIAALEISKSEEETDESKCA